MCHISNTIQTSGLKLGVRITGFGHFGIEGKCGVIMEINTVYWEYFYFGFLWCCHNCSSEHRRNGTFLYLWWIPTPELYIYHLSLLKFSFTRRLPTKEHNRVFLCFGFFFWLGFCFGFHGFVVEIEHIFWEQHEYMQTRLVFFFSERSS